MLAFGQLQFSTSTRRRAALAACIAAALPASAAPAGAEQLSAQAISDYMLGKRMIGVRLDTGESWFECIAESGDSIYSIEGQVSTGFVEIASDGETCFTYPSTNDTNKACFRVERDGGNAVFVEEVTGIRFRVTHTDKDFDGCSEAVPGS